MLPRAARIACLLLLATPSLAGRGQAVPDTFAEQSRQLAFLLGATFEMGRRCDVLLAGVSRASAGLLFDRYLARRETESALLAYDAGRASRAGARCDRDFLRRQIREADLRMRRYERLGRTLKAW